MNSILLSLLFGLSMASPSSSLSTRQSFSTDPNADCGLQAFGYGPPSAPPTDTGFTQSPVFQYASLLATTPSGYGAAFRNQTGSSASRLLGLLHPTELQYDPMRSALQWNQ